MNASVSFDTNLFVRRMPDAGMSQEQASALADTLTEVVFPSIATKGDLREQTLTLTSEIKDLELRLTTRMGAMIAASAAVVIAILGALNSLRH